MDKELKKKIRKRKIKSFFTTPFVVIKNFFFCLKYPFYISRNVFTDKFLGFTHTWYDEIPRGWRIAFGKQLSKDLKAALKKDGIIKTFRFQQIKEKYGTLRLYNNGEGENTHKVIRYYENLSMCYCFMCGKPARYCTQGWIEYLCEDCFKEIERYDDDADPEFSEYKKLCRLKEEDIPRVYSYSKEDGEKEIDLGIDFRKMWGLKDE